MNDLYRSQFRLPWDLYEALQEQATANERSLNAELVQRLQDSLSGQTSNSDIAAELRKQSEQIAHLTHLIESLSKQ
ncbi:Arc family DNA-binding protein [Chitinibacter fontanus]|uniref:Arc family DNA-binding protein n=1 Tax=Chitinibacter fontanus TaxID=1737446 RepID=A0A7D5V8J2_9NEIS|nr:Arc family DNA-binding protein [Chitinibacter fontanus]QLI80775.1 Arc family DNA-binding protein [Chitinibacter fontanus]